MKKIISKKSEKLIGKQPFKIEETEDDWILYHNDFSLCSRKVRFCLSELNIHYKSNHLNIIETGKAENLSKQFKYINPNVTVPVLIHKGFPIYESHEQIKYLLNYTKENIISDEENYWVQKGSLIGEPINNLDKYAGNCVSILTPPLFISMLKNISIFRFIPYYIFHPVKFRAFNFLIFKILGFSAYKKNSPLTRISHKAIKNLNKHMYEFNIQVTKNKWIVNSFFSIADITWAVLLHRLDELQIANYYFDIYPNIKNYYEQIKNKDSFKEAILRHNNIFVDKGITLLKKKIVRINELKSMYELITIQK